jgi:hypothetical protein
LDKEITKKNNICVSFIVLTLSLGLLFIYVITIQPIQILAPANAAETTNATQQGKSAANQTGEKMQAGAANVTQQGKSAANQTGETGQSLMNKTGETLQSFANKTGEALQKINPLK